MLKTTLRINPFTSYKTFAQSLNKMFFDGGVSMFGTPDLTSDYFSLEKVAPKPRARLKLKLARAGMICLEILALGVAACSTIPVTQSLEQTPLAEGQTGVTTQPAPKPVRIQPRVTVGAFEAAVNPPEYRADGRSFTGLTTAQHEALLAIAVFPVFRQTLVDSGQLQVGDLYFFEGVDQSAAQLAFEVEMQTFLAAHPELSVRMNQQDGQVLTFVEEKMVDGSSAIKYAFRQNGTLAYAEPNLFDVNTIEGNVPVRTGYRGEYSYNPSDQHWYLFEVDVKSGKASAWFKTFDATKDNLAQHWVKLGAPTDVPPETVQVSKEMRAALDDFAMKSGISLKGVEPKVDVNGDVVGYNGATEIYRIPLAEYQRYLEIRAKLGSNTVYFPGIWNGDYVVKNVANSDRIKATDIRDGAINKWLYENVTKFVYQDYKLIVEFGEANKSTVQAKPLSLNSKGTMSYCGLIRFFDKENSSPLKTYMELAFDGLNQVILLRIPAEPVLR